MASIQSNPGFVKGQIPTALQWNNAWTTKQDALLLTVHVEGDATVLNTACKYVCDTSAGNITITVPPSIGTFVRENRVRITKRSASANGNVVIITADGLTERTRITNENDGGGAGWLDIDVDGITITDICGNP